MAPVLPASSLQACTLGSTKEHGCAPTGPRPAPKAGDVNLPGKRWGQISKVLDLWLPYPGRCQGAIDDCNASWQVIIRDLAKIEGARLVEDRLEIDPGWPTWQVMALTGAVGAGAIAVGVLVGYVSGWLSTVAVP